jgi:LPXTG-motif cell wall-anchored protein
LDAQEADWEFPDDGRTAAREEKDPAMMNTERKPTWSPALFTALLLLIVMAGAALAATPTTTDYRNATTPMITGTASLVNEHQLLIQTEQGEEVLLSLDTRSMAPADLAPGMMMRVEFEYLEDGSRLAERVIPIRNGEKSTRELAYSNERQDNYGDAQLAATGEMRATDAHDDGTHAYDTHVSPAGSVSNQPLGTPLKPAPSTEAYRIATEPALAGRVGMVNDHHIVVDTDQGHSVPVEMDSRTLIPTDLQSGMGVRVEYKTLEDGTKLATRVTPLRDVPEREMATSSTRASQEEAVPASYNGGTSSDQAEDQMAQNQTDNENQEHDANANTSGDDRRLPKTASNEPLIATLGLLSLAAAGVLATRRRVG